MLDRWRKTESGWIKLSEQDQCKFKITISGSDKPEQYYLKLFSKNKFLGVEYWKLIVQDLSGLNLDDVIETVNTWKVQYLLTGCLIEDKTVTSFYSPD